LEKAAQQLAAGDYKSLLNFLSIDFQALAAGSEPARKEK